MDLADSFWFFHWICVWPPSLGPWALPANHQALPDQQKAEKDQDHLRQHHDSIMTGWWLSHLPFWNIWKSVGIIIPNTYIYIYIHTYVYRNKTFRATNQIHVRCSQWIDLKIKALAGASIMLPVVTTEIVIYNTFHESNMAVGNGRCSCENRKTK